MKWMLNLILIILTIMTNIAFADIYKIDSAHTAVVWKINHLGFSYQTGKWMVEGILVLDPNHPENSKVDVTIPLNKLITGNDELNQHLLGKQFLDAAAFPTAKFESSKVEVTGKNTAKVSGNLTLHGITKPIILNVTLNKMAINPITDKQTVGFSAIANIKRSDFGITTLLPQLGDEVDLDINLEAFKQ